MQYHKMVFAEPFWLFGVLLIPVLWLAFKFYRHKIIASKQLTEFADPELLPHLIQQIPSNKPKLNIFKIWCLLWLLGILAMAGPRYRFVEYETYKPDAALMIMLDLSQSMLAEDLKPNRIIRAKQQVEDILKFGRGIRIGLIGFAKIPHLITPITDDFATIKHLLPAVDVDLITKQGVDLQMALNMATSALQAEPGTSKHILIISDGNFTADVISLVRKLASNNIYVHAIGVGTEQGAPYKDGNGSWYKINDKMAISKLNDNILRNIAKIGQGKYWQANYNEQDLISFTKQIAYDTTNKHSATSTVKQWEEGFFWLLFPMLLLALIMQRKHLQLSTLIFVVLLCMPQPSSAFTLLKNSEQQGEQYYKNGDYEKAALTFVDPYRQGVALYKGGKFAEAEQAFKNSKRPDVAMQAKYNLGNAQLKQGKYKLAIDTYDSLLKEQPNYAAAKENLEIAKQLLKEEQKKPKSDKSCSCKNGKEQTNSNKQEQQSKSNNNDERDNKEEQQTENKDNKEGQDDKQKQDNAQQQEQKQQQNNKQNAITKKKENEKSDAELKKDNEPDSDKKQDKQNAISLPLDNKGNSDPETEILLKRLNNDIKVFLQNKFLIEEQ